VAAQAVRVEAMVGEAVVVFEDIECPDNYFLVPTSEAIETLPATCEVINARPSEDEKVGSIVWAIAQTDFDNPEAVEALQALVAAAGLTASEAAMVVVVIQNNPQHLGTDDSYVINAAKVVVQDNPAAAPLVLLAGTVGNPALADELAAAVIETAPDFVEQVDEVDDLAEDIIEEFQDDGPLQEGGGEEEEAGGDAAAGEGAEVITITEPDTGPPEQETPPADVPPPPTSDPTVPPGGSIPEVSPTPTPIPSPDPTPPPRPSPTPTPTPTPVPPTPTPVPPTPTPVPPTPTPVPPTPTPVPPTPTPIPPTPTPTPTPPPSPE
jgi:hypothetical protein